MKSFVLIVLLLVMPACSTVTPEAVTSSEASFDTGGANSGILEISHTHAKVTPRLRDRYNALINVYGEEFVPHVSKDYGISLEPDGKTYRMTLDALDYFLIMNTWRKMGRTQK